MRRTKNTFLGQKQIPAPFPDPSKEIKLDGMLKRFNKSLDELEEAAEKVTDAADVVTEAGEVVDNAAEVVPQKVPSEGS